MKIVLLLLSLSDRSFTCELSWKGGYWNDRCWGGVSSACRTQASGQSAEGTGGETTQGTGGAGKVCVCVTVAVFLWTSVQFVQCLLNVTQTFIMSMCWITALANVFESCARNLWGFCTCFFQFISNLFIKHFKNLKKYQRCCTVLRNWKISYKNRETKEN